MFKSKIIYIILLLLLIIIVANHGENIKNKENFITIDLKKAPILDIDNTKRTNKKTGEECKYPSDCESNECIKDPTEKMLCL
tara:strand:- start:537 stop:782 length:246 start_codon:yes stop_codon:yes gene_type:complete